MNLYTRKNFGRELKNKLLKKIDVEKIGTWAYTMYIDWPKMDFPFLDLLKHLMMMELGEEFYFTYEELDKIADDLIHGKEIKIPYGEDSKKSSS